MLTKGGGYYVADLIVRKLLLGQLVVSDQAIDWSQLRISDLKELCPDQSGFLEELPTSWSATDASSFFLGRPDQPLLLSKFFCLWKGAVSAVEARPAALLSLVGTERFAACIAAHEQETGAGASPSAALQRCLRQ